MPTNLYGPNDNFDLDQLARAAGADPQVPRRARSTGAREVVIWGTGTPRREFLHVDDLADACVFLMEHYDEEQHINVGTGEDLTIRELAEMVREIVYPEARLAFDTSKPDGTPRKLLDVSRLHALGWRHRIALREGFSRPTTGSWSTRTTHDAGCRRRARCRPAGHYPAVPYVGSASSATIPRCPFVSASTWTACSRISPRPTTSANRVSSVRRGSPLDPVLLRTRRWTRPTPTRIRFAAGPAATCHTPPS